MIRKLKDIVDVQFGLVLNRKEDITMKSEYKYEVLLSKSVKDNSIDQANISAFHSIEEIDETYFTKSGDILFKVTSPFDTVFINEETKNLLAASNFILIRPNKKIVIPKFLHWYINTSKTRFEIQQMTQGTSIMSIRSSDLLELNIKLPTIEKQREVVKFLELSERELTLLKELLENKEKYYKEVPYKIMQKK